MKFCSTRLSAQIKKNKIPVPCLGKCLGKCLSKCLGGLVFSLLSSFICAQDYALSASFGEQTLQNGFSPDPHTVEVVAGGSIDASSLSSECVGYIAEAPDFELNYEAGSYPLSVSFFASDDTTLIINTPSGEWVCDDDSGGGLNPKVEFSNLTSGYGVYDIWVGTFNDDDFVSGTLNISERSDFLPQAAPEGPFISSTNLGAGGEVFNGTLEDGDELYSDGSYMDIYSFNGEIGQEVIVDFRADNFDTYLAIRTPTGETLINDDYDGDTHRSLLSVILDDTGEYTISVTSFYKEETGAYSLGIDTEIGEENGIAANYSGALVNSDDYRSNGQFMDSYEFSGAPGRSVVLDLNSSEFDTYLILESPSGSTEENDDTDSVRHSRIETELTEFGTYRVYVSSYESGETGSYQLGIEEGDRVSQASQSGRDTVNVTLGRAYSGSLSSGDAQSNDKYQDYYAFSGNTGDNIRIELDSSSFDTYLSLQAPDGSIIDNDDYNGSTQRSVIEYQLPTDGRYSLIVTSYREEDIGDYRLIASSVSQNFSSVNQASAGSNIYGVFVGISDYSQLRALGSGASDLSFTRDDAIIVRDTLMASSGLSAENSITLLDQDATVENVRSAFAEMGRKVDEDDVFVFFYSGHGGQIERPGGPNAADADGYDETLALSNGSIIDDEMSTLFDQINARVSLIILDSCFSGGFSKDIVSKPGRMGLFSSDEDVPSLVASKFQAGGYLSHFFREAIENGSADINRDDSISAMELSQYLHERYNAESNGSKAMSSFNTPNFGYQHLVADRGGVAHDSILFATQ